MQNPQQQMAAMAMNQNMGGPVNGTPVMGNLQRPAGPHNKSNQNKDPLQTLNTYIYDYFIRNNHFQLAQTMLDSHISIQVKTDSKSSPNSGRNVNGVNDRDAEKHQLPEPDLPPNQLADNSFLGDWWNQFWDIWNATRSKSPSDGKSAAAYAAHTRTLATMSNDARTQRMMMGNMNPQQYQNMIRMQNGGPNDLKQRAAMNNRPNGIGPMGNMNQMKNQAMMSAQMQRDGSSIDMNGQRPQSPGSNENAPSPNKRPRVEGGMNTANMAGNQFEGFGPQGQNVQQKSIEGMNAAGVQGSPMAQQGLDDPADMFAGNNQRPAGMAAGTPGQPQQGNHALQDYQMQLMLLEQQNKKRLLMARQEQDSITGGPHQAGVGAPGFAPAMSPQGSRAGPSPNPADMKRNTPKLGQQGLPGSPMPDAAMQQQRNSPAPNMAFDPSQMPPGIPPQFNVGAYPQMGQNPMMGRPPSSHPGNFNPQQMNPQQMEVMRNNAAAMQNGAWRGPGGPQMMPGQAQQMGGPVNPQQRANANPMPPPPAPAPANEQPRTQEPSPSQQPAQAPPTPVQGNKSAPNKKKPTKDTKKPAKAKGANTGATPAASGEDPPPTPTTPMHPKSFGANGQPQAGQPPAQPQQSAAAPQQPAMDSNAPFGSLGEDNPPFDLGMDGFGPDNDLNTFDFDSFLHVGDDGAGFGSLGEFSFGDGVEAGADL